ncbi:3-ketoacyl-ACP reductase [Chitinophaga lutea]|uniref:3-ketoacyl-ACP reductase n=1 Tax=Chitinophaga lutea TaxID=2488634 RepID=A0A3N4PPJ9_9BACT|nr:3-ketoacyl-ACP reductase [Chitinophaga lutea]RPE08609.1 3-ketoacyl-ACP reductase [Chitinophaga lutea]
MKKVALITGGSRGIGLGIAEMLAQRGFRLAINGVREPAEVMDTIAMLQRYGTDVIYCQADVSDARQRERMLEQVQAHYGALHVLVNNAGVAPKERKDVLEMPEESYDRVMGMNLKGPFFLAQAVANWMLRQQQAAPDFSGCIINVSSISATVASVNRGEYCISKAGLSMVTQLLAVRLGAYGIPVYEVRPGIIATDMTTGVKEKYDQLISQGLLVQARWGTPEDVGKAVALLAAGELAYSTGQVIMVDGGFSIPRL